ncbi:MAG TPA: hypothetical protein VKB25_04805 [Conexibacter sp.]|nr:hypothetical protein [Conexibacter sp.]
MRLRARGDLGLPRNDELDVKRLVHEGEDATRAAERTMSGSRSGQRLSLIWISTRSSPHRRPIERRVRDALADAAMRHATLAA